MNLSMEITERTPAPPSGPTEKSKRIWPFIVALAVVLFTLATFFGEHGIVRELQHRREKVALEQEVHQIETQNEALRREIEALRNDRKYIETLARRELGMVKPDEIIYQFPPSGEKASAVKPPVTAR